jgi:4-carboxymuconolactone decarboxylase
MFFKHSASQRQLKNIASHLQVSANASHDKQRRHYMKDRYKVGLDNLEKIDGEAGHDVMKALDSICPDLGKYIIEFGFGDTHDRPGLSLRDREIATIAALTILGHTQPQLKVHIKAGLNVGLTQNEIKEIILQMSGYGGFPIAINGMLSAKEVFDTQ